MKRNCANAWDMFRGGSTHLNSIRHNKMKKYRTLLCLIAALTLTACNDTDDLRKAIDDLTGRVEALESQVDALNHHTQALQALYSGSTISEVKETDASYIILLTNGETLTLSKNSSSSALIPIVTIDGNGYWQVSYDQGQTFTSLGVKAVAEDGLTPVFRVDKQSGHWQISYDGGLTFEEVRDTNDQPVSAISSETIASQFFQNVRVEEDNLYLQLLNGTELNIPILSDFLCRITTPNPGTQLFEPGQTQQFAVQLRGVESTVIIAPEGWSAHLTAPVNEQAELVVTAPSGTAPTRATADTRQDVSIIATSGPYACIAKIQVESTAAVTNQPTITLQNSVTTPATTTTLTFEATLSSNAIGWKYICQATSSGSSPIPDAQTIWSTGTDVKGQSRITITDLSPKTSYTLYAVAYTDTRVSEVASITNTTTGEATGYTDYYLSGTTVNGVRYDCLSEGARLVEVSANATENTLISFPGTASVTFLGDINSASYCFTTKQGTGTAVTTNHILIGRYSTYKPKVILGGYMALRNVGGTIAFKNLTLDCSQLTTAYSFLISSNGTQTGGIENLIFEDCDITFSQTSLISLANASTNSIGNIIFRNCKIAYTGTTNSNFILANQTNLSGQADFKTLTFENNIIYMTQEALGSHVIFNGQNNAFSNLAVTFTHNTVVNYLPSGGQGAVLVATACAAYSNLTYNLYFSSPSLARASNVFAIRMTNGNPSTMGPTEPNMAFGTFATASNSFKNYYGGQELTLASASPFSSMDLADGQFIKTAEATAFGSTLE